MGATARLPELMERHQVALYLSALALGAVVGLGFPAVAGPASATINPVLALLLYSTFLGVPFARIGEALRDGRFLLAALGINFLVVPPLVWLLSRVVAHDPVLLVGVLFILLAPCVDYVIVFTGIAGGAKDRLMAAAPLLMLVQMGLLPLFLWLFVGDALLGAIDPAPFVEALVLLILLPLAAAGLTQWAATRTRLGRCLQGVVLDAMVPLLMATLAVVVASQVASVGRRLGSLILVVPIYALFAAVMVPVGMLVGAAAGLDVPGRRALVFTGVTRNSLVVLPLVLALPRSFELAPLVVVTQTLVELLVMVALVRLVPRIVPLGGP